MHKFSIAMLALALTASCAKKQEAPKEEEKVSAEEAAKDAKDAKEKAAKAKEAEIAALAEELQTKEDFEEAAEGEINDENLEAELAKLEAEIDPSAEEAAGKTAETPKPAVGAQAAPKKPAAPAGE